LKRLPKTSKNFKGLHETPKGFQRLPDFKRLPETPQDFTKLHETSRTFRDFSDFN
jgi:hypothetical protein